ncbi:DUF4162 domain-containing protein [Aeromicrobium sp. UC242_57]|uniref:ATP-binding protein DrrA1-3 family domain-containing protein n=1 Tax=Aeromicrobium sp. UC242_57 TaxID=3374624 RepID=UPI0037A5811E
MLTTHYLEEADSMAERVVVIDHGQIIADDTADALKAEQAGDRITVTVAPGDVATTREVVASIGAELAEAVSGGGVDISFRVDSGPVALPGVLRALQDKGVMVEAATLKQPTLDDVFLNLTGRSLREGAEA